jgi:hypothetical protein
MIQEHLRTGHLRLTLQIAMEHDWSLVVVSLDGINASRDIEREIIKVAIKANPCLHHLQLFDL